MLGGNVFIRRRAGAGYSLLISWPEPDPGHFVLLMRLSCRRFRIYCRLTFSVPGAGARVFARDADTVTEGIEGRTGSFLFRIRAYSVPYDDDDDDYGPIPEPPGIRLLPLGIIILSCQSPKPKGDIVYIHHTDRPRTFSVCVIVIIRVIFFETIFFSPTPSFPARAFPASYPGTRAGFFTCSRIPSTTTGVRSAFTGYAHPIIIYYILG